MHGFRTARIEVRPFLTRRAWRLLAVAVAVLALTAPHAALTSPRVSPTDELPPCPDLDVDGFAVCDEACFAGGMACGDCDDARSGSHPGAAETCNHFDDDCNGEVDETSPKVFAQQTLFDAAASPGDRFGAAIALLGDLDGDGVADLAIGAPTTDTGSGNDAGAVTLVSGASRAVLCTATDTTDGRAGDRLGTSVARLSDVTGDGIPDVAAGAPGTTAPNTQGRVLVISGADCSIVRSSTDSVIVTLPGGAQSQSYSEIGTVVTSIGDLNGDGFDEILAGDPNALLGNINVLSPQNGRAVVFSGSTGAPLRRIVPQLNGENNVRFGSSVAALGDLTGDGISEYAIGSILSPDLADTQFGKVRVYSGSNGALLRTLADLSPEAELGGMGGAVAAIPDLDGDGVTDIAAGEALGDDAGTADTGAVVLFSGASGALLRRCTAPDGLAADQLGRALAALPDLNGDGIAEIAASAPLDDTPRGNNSGSIVIFSGADCTALARVFDRIGSSGSRLADRSLVAVPDFLGDNDPDLIAGSGYDASNAGTVPGRALLLGLESDCDEDGYTPDDGDCDDADPASLPDGNEICDGRDNNCDGFIDENEPSGGEPCQTGLQDPCAAGTTSCAGGTYACIPDAGAPEICDGFDNDCDGTIDDGLPVNGTPCETGLPGVCAAGLTLCDASGVTCVQSVPAGAEICDGLDNDCNGAADEGDPGSGDSCSTGIPGICSPGVRHCVGGALACVQDVPASPETCDAVDNDCDGAIDDGNPDGGVDCPTFIPGVCSAGVTFCTGGLLDCVPNVAPSSESCNGLDDDCDGGVDEFNPGGGTPCSTGEPGACAAGLWQCEGGTFACRRIADPDDEICDGIDNDCDGVVDDSSVDIDGDGVSACFDNCFGVPNSGQEDSDQDGFGDVCDTCPTVANADQNPCACNACGVSNIVLTSSSGGNGLVRWQTDMEHAVVGFNVVQIDHRGVVTKLNGPMIPCTECTSDRGAAYAVPVAKLKPSINVFVEQIAVGGQITRYGPAIRQ